MSEGLKELIARLRADVAKSSPYRGRFAKRTRRLVDEDDLAAALDALEAADALSAQPAPQPSGEKLTPEEAWRDLLEKDDRTSPEEYPEMCLITRDELFDYMAHARSAISSQTSPQGKQGVHTELARLGSQEATPNTGVKLEGGGG